jgi:hypothetical protein
MHVRSTCALRVIHFNQYRQKKIKFMKNSYQSTSWRSFINTTKIPVDIFYSSSTFPLHICVISNAKRARHTFTAISHIDNNNYEYCHSTFVRERERALIQGKTCFFMAVYISTRMIKFS